MILRSANTAATSCVYDTKDSFVDAETLSSGDSLSEHDGYWRDVSLVTLAVSSHLFTPVR